MELIKEELFNIDNKYESCIKKTVFIHKKEIPRNNEITAAYNRLRQISFIGSQYDWLARYMWSAGIKLDLSVHEDDTVNYFLSDNVRKVRENNDAYYVLSPLPEIPQKTDMELVFRYYNFPLLHLTKPEMERNSIKNNFIQLMNLTWFCHRPTQKGTPCGICNPCLYTKNEGLGRRVPLPSLRARMHHILRKTKHLLKKNS